jgi:hypothetical protein
MVFEVRDLWPEVPIAMKVLKNPILIYFSKLLENNIFDNLSCKQIVSILSIFTNIKVDENVRERYTIGGLQTIKEKVGIVPLIKLGSLDFKDVKTTINVSSQPRIGIGFFKDCIIYIDNHENNYKIKK